MNDTTTPPTQPRRPADQRPDTGSANLRFGMPATWGELVALGLDPVTGEVA